MTDNTFEPATTVVDDILGDYTLDAAHTHLGFSARHAMVTTVRGQFNDFTGEAVVDTATPANSTVVVNIKAAGIDTGVADRNAHLRSADFFDVEKYPEITFTSTHVERDGDDWAITGDLTIKDVTKPITIEFESSGSARDPFGNLRIGFEGKATLSRKDWGLTWNAALETGGMLVSDKIKLDFDISAIAK
jgi:polyisoprenoid-binding protein YceI